MGPAAICAFTATSTRKVAGPHCLLLQASIAHHHITADMPPRPQLRLGQLALPIRPLQTATPLSASASTSTPRAAAAALAATAPHQQVRGIRSIVEHPSPTDRFNRGPHMRVLGASSTAALERKAYTTPLRTGALAIKKGMTALYDPETGARTPCTVLQLDRCQVVAHKTRDRHGYWAVAVGAGWKHPSNVTRPLLGHYAGQGVSPKRWVREFRVRDERGLLGVGEMVGPEWFKEGQFVDARADSRGMGFAGVSGLSWSGCFFLGSNRC